MSIHETIAVVDLFVRVLITVASNLIIDDATPSPITFTNLLPISFFISKYNCVEAMPLLLGENLSLTLLVSPALSVKPVVYSNEN